MSAPVSERISLSKCLYKEACKESGFRLPFLFNSCFADCSRLVTGLALLRFCPSIEACRLSFGGFACPPFCPDPATAGEVDFFGRLSGFPLGLSTSAPRPYHLVVLPFVWSISCPEPSPNFCTSVFVAFFFLSDIKIIDGYLRSSAGRVALQGLQRFVHIF